MAIPFLASDAGYSDVWHPTRDELIKAAIEIEDKYTKWVYALRHAFELVNHERARSGLPMAASRTSVYPAVDKKAIEILGFDDPTADAERLALRFVALIAQEAKLAQTKATADHIDSKPFYGLESPPPIPTDRAGLIKAARAIAPLIRRHLELTGETNTDLIEEWAKGPINPDTGVFGLNRLLQQKRDEKAGEPWPEVRLTELAPWLVLMIADSFNNPATDAPEEPADPRISLYDALYGRELIDAVHRRIGGGFDFSTYIYNEGRKEYCSQISWTREYTDPHRSVRRDLSNTFDGSHFRDLDTALRYVLAYEDNADREELDAALMTGTGE